MTNIYIFFNAQRLKCSIKVRLDLDLRFQFHQLFLHKRASASVLVRVCEHKYVYLWYAYCRPGPESIASVREPGERSDALCEIRFPARSCIFKGDDHLRTGIHARFPVSDRTPSAAELISANSRNGSD